MPSTARPDSVVKTDSQEDVTQLDRHGMQRINMENLEVLRLETSAARAATEGQVLRRDAEIPEAAAAMEEEEELQEIILAEAEAKAEKVEMVERRDRFPAKPAALGESAGMAGGLLTGIPTGGK